MTIQVFDSDGNCYTVTGVKPELLNAVLTPAQLAELVEAGEKVEAKLHHPYQSNCLCKLCTSRKGAARGRRGRPVVPERRPRTPRAASKSEQHGRYIDSGPAAWDDR